MYYIWAATAIIITIMLIPYAVSSYTKLSTILYRGDVLRNAQLPGLDCSATIRE